MKSDGFMHGLSSKGSMLSMHLEWVFLANKTCILSTKGVYSMIFLKPFLTKKYAEGLIGQ